MAMEETTPFRTTRSGTKKYPPSTAPKAPGKSKQEKLDDKTQVYLEAIYVNINALWKQACEFPATFKLPDFSNILPWPAGQIPKRFVEAKNLLGEALLCLSLRSESFLELLTEKPSSNKELWEVLLVAIKNSKTSLSQFVMTRNLDWFRGTQFTDVVVPASWTCPDEAPS